MEVVVEEEEAVVGRWIISIIINIRATEAWRTGVLEMRD